MATTQYTLLDLRLIAALADRLPVADAASATATRERQASLTKPPGSLGRLEELAEFMAAWRATPRPEITRAQDILWNTFRLVVEPGGAAAFSAIVSGRYAPAKDEHVVVVLSGGNTQR